MSITWDGQGEDAAVRIETHYAHALLIPAMPIARYDEKAKQAFFMRLARWQAAGYADEDAATLALFELTIARHQLLSIDSPQNLGDHADRTADSLGSMPISGELMTQVRFFPKLIDLSLAPESMTERLSGLAFAPMQDPEAGIYPIVDQLPMLNELLNAGVRIIQLRIKSELNHDVDGAVREAIRMSAAFPKAQLFINDHWQSAMEHGAYGVHLGQEDLLTADLGAIGKAGLRLGVSSHAYWEVARALTIKPSYIACGPVFPTRAKVMPWKSQGIGNLAYWSRLITHPVVAIGGINSENLADVAATGCASAAVIAAIVASPDPAGHFQSLQQQWMSCHAKRAKGLPQHQLVHALDIAKPTLIPEGVASGA